MRAHCVHWWQTPEPGLTFEIKGDLISLAILGKKREVWLDVCKSKFPHGVKYELRKTDNWLMYVCYSS